MARDAERPVPPASHLRNPWMLASIAAALSLAITFDPRLYINGDNVDYMFLARAVRAGHFWPSEKYPPLFPYLLAPIQALFGLRLIPQKLLVLAFGVGSVWMLQRIVHRRVPGVAGAGLFFCMATLIPVVEYSHYTMSEVPYLFFSLGALDALDRWPARGPTWRSTLRPAVFLALWLAAAFYTRSAGIALVAAVFFVLLRRREFQGSLALAGGMLLLGLPWLIHSLSAPGGSPYLQQWIQIDPYYPGHGRLDLSGLIQRLGGNAALYLLKETPATVLPLIYHSTYSTPDQGYLPMWLGLPLLLPLLLGWWRGMKQGDPLASVLLFSLALDLFWPDVWASSRFLVPIVPLLLYSWWMGWNVPAPRLGKLFHRPELVWGRARQVLLALLLVLAVRNLVEYRLETLRYPAPWENYFAALRWIRTNTPDDAVIIDRKPGFVEFVAERTAVSFRREPDPDRMLRQFQESRAGYVILPTLPYDDIFRYLEPALRQRKDCFKIVAKWEDPPVYVFHFYPPDAGRKAE